jgi:hypothetical protein
MAHLRHVGMSVVSPLFDEDQTGNRHSRLVNHAAGKASNAGRLSAASMAGRNIFNGLTTIQQSLIVSVRLLHVSQVLT